VTRTPAEILTEARTIALVGASPKPHRPSNSVMRYLLREGYHVIPVRPVGPEEILGQRRVGSLAEIDEPIDVVDVFHRSEFCPDVARQAVEAGAGALWLQLGVGSAVARASAGAAGLDDVENECTAIVHARLAS
jgi:predicted CoA-binding protein